MTEQREFDRSLTAEITLDFPIEVDGQKIEKVTMRRPKVRDSFKAERAKGDEMAKGIALLCDLCEMPEEHLLELDTIDLEKLHGQLEAFTGRTLTP
jgi:hypothetical protein